MERPNFDIELLPDVIDFLNALDEKARGKIYYNMKKSQFIYDQELFKKLSEFVWEFRTLYNGKYYRLLSFWDKSDGAWVVATHGFIKTTAKTPPKEIAKAEEIRGQYLENKKRTKKK
jgi:phage-related protein